MEIFQRLVVVAEIIVDRADIVVARGYVRMVGPEDLYSYIERFLEIFECILRFAEVTVGCADIVIR